MSGGGGGACGVLLVFGETKRVSNGGAIDRFVYQFDNGLFFVLG